MQTTHTPFGLHWPVAEQTVDARLRWLENANREALIRPSREATLEAQMMMRRPLKTRRAYALFGMLLGALPSAAIFFRLFSTQLNRPVFQWNWFFLLLAMNIVCFFAGKGMGTGLSGAIETAERGSWKETIFVAPFVGLMWGGTTGAAGGFLFFGIGAAFGALFAAPVGVLGYALFTPLHRLLSRGGMIEARHFWPLACGVVMLVVALILSPNLFAY